MTTDRIRIYIADKHHPAGWRIVGLCPETVSWSSQLYIYRGRPARVYDCLTDELIAQGRSLRDVLTKLANRTGLTVEILDEETERTTTIRPARAVTP